MSQLLIQQYLNQLDTLKKVSGTTRESAVREALHLQYESVSPLNLKRTNVEDKRSRAVGMQAKCVLKANQETGKISIDSETTLDGVRR